MKVNTEVTERKTELPGLVHPKQQGARGELLFHILRVCSSAPTPPGTALLFCTGEVQGPLYWVLQLLRDKASSPALNTSGPAPPLRTGSEGDGHISLSLFPMPPYGRWKSGSALPRSADIWSSYTISTCHRDTCPFRFIAALLIAKFYN